MLAFIGAALITGAAPLTAQTDQVDVAWALANAQATVTNSPLDIGQIGDVFDNNTDTLARSAAVNPMVVTLTFVTPKQLIRSRVWFLAGSNRWRIETADSVADLDAGSGTFRVALDWDTGDEATWQDRSFTEPITCRAVRLTLYRPTGDDYVHLNEWQLFLLDRPFIVTDLQKAGAELQLTWNSSPTQWYEIQTSQDLLDWSSVTFQKGAENITALQFITPPGERRFFRVRKALPEERPHVPRRVLVLNVDPILEEQNNQTLDQYLGWNNPHDLTAAYLGELGSASGGYVQWQVAGWVDLDLWPVKLDGFRYDDTTYLQSWFDPGQYPWHDPDAIDYEALLDLPLSSFNNQTAHQLVAAGQFDEIICWCFPYGGLYESRMVGNRAYFCNAPPLERVSPLYVVMGLNPERGVGEALHSFGHRCESIIARIYGSWSGTSDVNHLWDRFTQIGPKYGVSVAGCGNVHYPPNASHDYEYDIATPVTSEADSWLNFPVLSGEVTSVNAESWGGPDYQRNYLRWWMARFPKARGRYLDTTNQFNDGKLNNWWSYIVDMNEYAESR